MARPRVLLDPVVLEHQAFRPQRVAGAIVGVQDVLTLFAEASEDPKPASLRLFGRYLIAPREAPPSFTPFGTLECELAGRPDAPELNVALEAKVVLDVPPSEDDLPPRQVFLQFPSTDAGAGRVVVDLPEPTEADEDARFFELGVELSVSGATQAAIDLNDILDIPLLARRLGLTVEWPNALDKKVPPSLVLSAKQGDKVRNIAWSNGKVFGDVRQFFFRGILGPAPVTLEAVVGEQRTILWDQQDTSETQTKAPAWATTLEDTLFVKETGDVSFEVQGKFGAASPVSAPVPTLDEF